MTAANDKTVGVFIFIGGLICLAGTVIFCNPESPNTVLYAVNIIMGVFGITAGSLIATGVLDDD